MSFLISFVALVLSSGLASTPKSILGVGTVSRLDAQPATCGKVIYRLNEMAARLRELGHVAKSFRHKERLSPAEIQEFSELVRRALSPNFGRVDFTVSLQFDWALDASEVELSKLSTSLPSLRKRLALQTLNWDDANGLLPFEIKLSLRDNILSLQYFLTPEQYCLGKPLVTLDLFDGDSLLFHLAAKVPKS